MNKVNGQEVDKTCDLLNNIKFPKCYSRKNMPSGSSMFCLGEVNYRGQRSLNYKTRGPSKWNDKYPELFEHLKTLVPNESFQYTTIQINKNIQSPPHVDKNNVGDSYIIAFGNYEGGDLIIEGVPYNIKNRFFRFDGTKAHWTAPFEGTRYSIIYFTHTFKPPSYQTRGVVVTTEGLYKNGKLIKSFGG